MWCFCFVFAVFTYSLCIVNQPAMPEFHMIASFRTYEERISDRCNGNQFFGMCIRPTGRLRIGVTGVIESFKEISCSGVQGSNKGYIGEVWRE